MELPRLTRSLKPNGNDDYRRRSMRIRKIASTYEKPKTSEKKVKIEVETTREITRFFASPGNSRAGSSSMKVVPHRKPKFSPSNIIKSSRKRKLSKKDSILQDGEHKVASKWLDYYEDGSTDDEIEPLVNRRTVKNKRMKVSMGSIKKEKEEMETKLREAMERKLLCAPGSSQDNALEISDDDSS